MRADQCLSDDCDAASFDGVRVRKGTVGAFLANACVLGSADASAEARERSQADLLALLPALRALGLFEILEIRDPALRAWVDAH